MLRDLFSLFPAYAGVILQKEAPKETPKELFPAYAGVILELEAKQWPKEPFPRIRGGDPKRRYHDTMKNSFSPHTRG